ncbi:hypothetical protein DAPPUDRAFT_113333 [Daphnia pulex]|uniref:Uncharacterized protein n=1 Tax=Daphnia pulex TaxID=6669 RepID=E9HER5_DAPPU|nr:hypothetical protein DAPPUDRAFT_113333 [Daphnia pulex]|eukprot:EFX69716.1 hypothetical protein DAPPUDRAFT_113333 [Daphnia pulex]
MHDLTMYVLFASISEDILHARQLLFPSVAPPSSPEVLHPCATDGSFFTESPNPTLCLRNTTPRDDPPTALHCEVGAFVGHSPDSSDDAYSSPSERALSSLLSDIPPWNVGACHFDIPQRSARLANLSHHTRKGQSRRCAPSRSTASVHSGHILPFGEPLRSPPLPDETPLHTAAGYFNLPQLGPSSRPLMQQHQSVPCHVQQYEDMVNLAAEPLPIDGADDHADPLDDDEFPPPPKLTDQQRQWNAAFHSLLPTDLEGLSALSQEIAAAAAERKDAALPDQSRNAVPTQRGTRRAPPRRQQYNPQDASEIQKLYRIDRNKAMTHILAEPSPYCAADPAAIEAHLSTIFSGTDHPWSDPPPCVPEFTQTTTPEELTFLTAPITPREVANRLQRMKNTAPGPDGARYAGLRRADPGCHTLALIYSRCLAQAQEVAPTNQIPAHPRYNPARIDQPGDE